LELKKYQQRVLSEVEAYLLALTDARRGRNPDYGSDAAWHQLREELGLSLRYHRQTNGAGADMPNICLKVPTGGGKTLLATQILGLAYKTLLTARNGAGLVLWVVPSDQIYKDILKALKNKRHPYREALEFALSRRVEVWEKHEIARLNPSQLATCLNVLVVKLQGANRQDKESLKFFQDSGGNIVQHFPPEDDPEAHRRLKELVPNLDMLAEDPATGSYLAKTSVGNLARLCEPVVILDEGHKATSELARRTIAGFNPCLVVELSATPHKEANLLCRVTGRELLQEQMIKLPINVSTSRVTTFENCVTMARDKREQLARLALQHYRDGGRLIRPIVLVQVERTGKDQIDTGYIHSEQVKEYLIGRLGVAKESIAIKTSEKDDIEGIDLMDENCRIDWILTKSALQEGWDCPYAYILVSLSNTRSTQSMTQLVGRVLRQPFVEKTPFEELNESYVYCLKESAETVVREVRAALTKEGYEGDSSSVVNRSDSDAAPAVRVATVRPKFRQFYQEFDGRIFLPHFCVRTEAGDERLDYYRHLLSKMDIRRYDFARAAEWDLSDELRAATEQMRRIGLNDDALEPIDVRESVVLDDDNRTRAWLTANLGMEWLSAKEARYIVHEVCARLPGLDGKLSMARFRLLEKLKAFVQDEALRQTKAAFHRLHDTGELFFGLACIQCRFTLPPSIERRRIKALRRHDDTDLQKSLFDFEADEQYNEYERNVALFLDTHPDVLWWYRNLVGEQNFEIWGWRPGPVYPDFVVQIGENDDVDAKPRPLVWVIESKGRHLAGNTDTQYKRELARLFEDVGKQVSWQSLGEGFDHHRFRFQVLDQGDAADRDWRDELERMLSGALSA
jgi:type III restriction enzyme